MSAATIQQIQESARKDLADLRKLLTGAKYYHALRALELMLKHHKGYRKDGVTPEWHHPVRMTLDLFALRDLMLDPEGTLVTSILHDTPEDYPVYKFDIMPVVFPFTKDRDWGEEVCNSIELLNKYERDETPKDEAMLYAAMAADPRASIVKPKDRSSNFATMQGVFTYAKQASYIEFAEQIIFPMVKLARRNFPEQAPIYVVIKDTLRIQIELLSHLHKEVTDMRRIDIVEAAA